MFVREYSPLPETQVSFQLTVMNAIQSRPESATVPRCSSLEVTTNLVCDIELGLWEEAALWVKSHA